MNLNSTFIHQDDDLLFDEYLELQTPDEDEAPLCSTHNNFNAPIDFDVFLRSYSALISSNDFWCLSFFSLDYIPPFHECTPTSFSVYLARPYTTRFYIRYDHSSFYLFATSQNYTRMYGL